MVKKLGLALLNVQSNINQESPCVAMDFADTMDPPEIDIGIESEQDNRASGGFDMYPATIGRSAPTVKLSYSLLSLGASREPSLVQAMKCAGWSVTTVGNYIELRPTSTITSAATVYGYIGGPGASKALLTKIINVMFSATIDLPGAKRAFVTLDGKGKLFQNPTVATMPDVSKYRDRGVAPAIISAGVEINGDTYKWTKAQIKDGQAVVNNLDPSVAYGGGDTEITDRAMTFTATVFAKTSPIPHTKLQAGTAGQMVFSWGAVYGSPDLQISCNSVQLTDVKPGDENGVDTYEVTGVILENDIIVKVYNGGSSESMWSESDSSQSISISSASGSSSSISASSTSL
jgi:hypothetical protein